MNRVRVALLVFACLGGGIRAAQAQPDTAQQQFDYGLSEMKAGRFTTGCTALEESYKLDPRPGTLFTVAECNAKAGKTATALGQYEEYIAVYDRMADDQKVRQQERKRIATQQRDALARRVPMLAVTVGPTMPPNAIVKRDAIVLGGPLRGALLRVDPGEHTVRVEIADGRSAETKITLHDSEQNQIEAPIPPAPVVTVVKPAAPPAPTPPSSTQKTAAYVAAGVGAAGLGVAIVTGILALSKKSTASSHCDANGGCDSANAVDAGNSAHSLANVETGALIVAGLGAGAAAVLWFTRPHDEAAASARARVTPYLTGDRTGPRGGVSIRW